MYNAYKDNLEKIYDINSIPDVPESHKYYDEIKAFYDAGYICGADDKGNCEADRPVKRSEVATVAVRNVLKEDLQNNSKLEAEKKAKATATTEPAKKPEVTTKPEPTKKPKVTETPVPTQEPEPTKEPEKLTFDYKLTSEDVERLKKYPLNLDNYIYPKDLLGIDSDDSKKESLNRIFTKYDVLNRASLDEWENRKSLKDIEQELKKLTKKIDDEADYFIMVPSSNRLAFSLSDYIDRPSGLLQRSILFYQKNNAIYGADIELALNAYAHGWGIVCYKLLSNPKVYPID